VGTSDDLWQSDGTPMRFPAHVRSLVDQLCLLELAGVLASSGAVVANDSGIGHIAAALGVQTVLIFGPTPDRALGRLPSNTRVVRTGGCCEPCWFNRRFAACDGRITCLRELSADQVASQLCVHTEADVRSELGLAT
jgi:ADP-heptose:LPS heptosyltransferase